MSSGSSFANSLVQVAKERPLPVDRFCVNMNDMAQLAAELLQKANGLGCFIVDPTLVALGLQALETYDRTMLITRFIDYSVEYWDQIKERNQNFIEQNIDSIFSNLPMGDVKAFHQLFKATNAKGDPIIDNNDREDIWQYMDAFVMICLDYIHWERIPDVIERNDEKMAIYRRHFMDNIKLERHCKTWGYQRVFSKRKT